MIGLGKKFGKDVIQVLQQFGHRTPGEAFPGNVGEFFQMGLDLLQFQGAEGQGFFHAASISNVPLEANDQIHRALAVKMGIGRNLINMIFALGRKGLIGQYRPASCTGQ